MSCTYKIKDRPVCEAAPSTEQVGRDGRVWAALCATHQTVLEAAICEGGKSLLREWIRSGGGARAMAARHEPAIKALARGVLSLVPLTKP